MLTAMTMLKGRLAKRCTSQVLLAYQKAENRLESMEGVGETLPPANPKAAQLSRIHFNALRLVSTKM